MATAKKLSDNEKAVLSYMKQAETVLAEVFGYNYLGTNEDFVKMQIEVAKMIEDENHIKRMVRLTERVK